MAEKKKRKKRQSEREEELKGRTRQQASERFYSSEISLIFICSSANWCWRRSLFPPSHVFISSSNFLTSFIRKPQLFSIIHTLSAKSNLLILQGRDSYVRLFYNLYIVSSLVHNKKKYACRKATSASFLRLFANFERLRQLLMWLMNFLMHLLVNLSKWMLSCDFNIHTL